MYLGIDPGRSKTGWAIVDEEGRLYSSGIIRDSKPEFFADIILFHSWESLEKGRLEGYSLKNEEITIEKVILGSGTTSRDLREELEKKGIPFTEVNERDTTLQSKKEYWKIKKTGILRRTFPFLKQFLPRDTDDIAALLIARRFLRRD
jgi:hypothetical protein